MTAFGASLAPEHAELVYGAVLVSVQAEFGQVIQVRCLGRGVERAEESIFLFS